MIEGMEWETMVTREKLQKYNKGHEENKKEHREVVEAKEVRKISLELLKEPERTGEVEGARLVGLSRFVAPRPTDKGE
jgi:hypothetical protein